MPEDQIKQGLEMLKDPTVIAKAFDAAKDFLTDVVVAGVPGDEEKFVVVIKCHEMVTPDMVKSLPRCSRQSADSSPSQDARKGRRDDLRDLGAPISRNRCFSPFPRPASICLGASKDLVEKAAAGGAKGGHEGGPEEAGRRGKEDRFRLLRHDRQGDG